jgi:pimeloyl-ACP methyl ester carboxylesterase
LPAHRRVAATTTSGWDRGNPPEYLAALVGSWADDDWRPHEQRIRALPWVRTSRLRAVHQHAAAPTATAVVLLHGWPDSVLRYERVLPLLTDVDVVVPALPGFPLAAALPEHVLSSADMAEIVAEAMAELGSERYVVSGGDIGRGVATALAFHHPDRVAALHLTDIGLPAASAGEAATASEEERAYRTRVEDRRAAEGGYLHEQANKPHTLAVALGDSPAGLAAWIVQKLRAWSDCGGDVESVFPREQVLTWVTAHWVTGAIGTSFAPYAKPSPRPGRIAVPTVVSQFPAETVRAPRSVAERLFDLRGWHQGTAGGHFAAWERPDEFVGFLRTAMALA